MVQRAWLVITLGDDRQYGGNAGYSDEPSRLYRYDSAVANHKQVSVGDLFFVRDKAHLLGVGIVEAIRQHPAEKERSRCPACGSTALKARKNIEPRWKCKNGHEFDEPIQEKAKVIAYEADYGDRFVRADGKVTSEELKRAALRPSDQLSIEEIDPTRLPPDLRSRAPAVFKEIVEFGSGKSLDGNAADKDRNDIAAFNFLPTIGDQREEAWAAIKKRRGQARFRRSLMKRYGPACMVTGCTIVDVLEAAHISPFRGTSDNHLDNGLLLRADLHTLFDVGLLSIHPTTLTVRIALKLEASEYGRLDGLGIRLRAHERPSEFALQAHWTMFLKVQEGQGKSPSIQLPTGV